ncbi:hypothetical protein JOM56_013186, partial [Amanita muscaria]
DDQFRIPNGTLLFHENRDAHLPYIYIVPDHPLVDHQKFCHSSQGRILVFIVDTDPISMAKQYTFEQELVVPLGPDVLIKSLGLFELIDDDIVFARDLHGPLLPSGQLDPMNDVVQAW